MSSSDNSEAGPSRLEKAWHLHCNIVILVKAGQWDAVEKRLNTKKVPRNKSVKRILNSIRQTDFKLLLQPDGRGRLPIHWACTRGDSLKKKAAKALIDAQPGSIRHRDSEGSTPLHILFCGCLKNTEVSKLLIQSYPEALTVRDVFGRTPMFHLVHCHLASYVNDEDFPARRLIPVLENLLSRGNCVDALTLPCGPIDEYRSPAEASNIGPSHTFPNLWRAPPMHRTPLYMMWHYAINANTPLWRSGRKAKINKKKMRVALLFLRCVYLKEVNGSFDFDLRRKNRVLRQLVKQARESKRFSAAPSSEIESSLDHGIMKSPQGTVNSASQREKENDVGTLESRVKEEECDIKSISVSDEEFTTASPLGLSILAQTKSGRSIMGEDFFGSSRLSVMSRISIPLSDFDDVGMTDDELQHKQTIPQRSGVGIEKQSSAARATKNFRREEKVEKFFGRLRSNSASDDSIDDDSQPQNYSFGRRRSSGIQMRYEPVADKVAESRHTTNHNIEASKQDGKNSIDLSEIEDHSFFEWMSSRKRRSNKQLIEQTKFRLTHATVTFHSLLPTSEILDMALKYCPYQLVKREAKTGCIPLHLAILKNAGYLIIKRLLETDISSAKIRTSEGQLPLHLALSQKDCDAETINCIFQAYPDAIKEKDPVSLLYPFMIPASLGKNNSTESTLKPRDDDGTQSSADAEDVKVLTNTYELLMLNPHIAEIDN